MKGFPFLICLLLLPFISNAQERKEEKSMQNGLVAGIFAHTFGFGGNLEYYHFREGKDLVFSLAFASVRHRKEQKTESLYKDQGGKDFRYFKKNYFYTLVPSFGFSGILLENTPHNKIGLRTSFSAGPIFGFLQPYYLKIGIPVPGTNQLDPVDAPFDNSQHNPSNIVGLGDPLMGFDELEMVFGLQLRVATILNFSSSSEVIHGIEMGLNADLYPKKVEIMDNPEIQNKSVFLSGTVGVLFGSAW